MPFSWIPLVGWLRSCVPLLTRRLWYVLHSSSRQTSAPIVTTDDVLNEVVALLTTDSRGIARLKLIQFVNQIRSSPQVRVVHVDEQIWNEAWALLERMSDKSWSWVDASSFVVMRRLGLTEAFTSDHHFTQAGFVQVPLP